MQADWQREILNSFVTEKIDENTTSNTTYNTTVRGSVLFRLNELVEMEEVLTSVTLRCPPFLEKILENHNEQNNLNSNNNSHKDENKNIKYGFDRNGNVKKAFSIGGTGEDRARGIAIDLKGNILIAGYFYSTTLLG